MFVFKQKTAYEMRISDWSSDVCSSDLGSIVACASESPAFGASRPEGAVVVSTVGNASPSASGACRPTTPPSGACSGTTSGRSRVSYSPCGASGTFSDTSETPLRSEEQTSELQSLIRTSYAAFCLKKKKTSKKNTISDIKLTLIIKFQNLIKH